MEQLERPRRAAAFAAVLALSLSLGAAGTSLAAETDDALDAAILSSGAAQEGAAAAGDEASPDGAGPSEEEASDDESSAAGDAEASESQTDPSNEGADDALDGTAASDSATATDEPADEGLELEPGISTSGNSATDEPASDSGAEDSAGEQQAGGTDMEEGTDKDVEGTATDGADATEGSAEATATVLETDGVLTTSATTEAESEGSNGVSLLTTAAVSNGWDNSSGSWRHYTNGKMDTGWLVTGTAPGSSSSGELERYWLDPETGNLVTSSLISASEAGWWAYATSSGAVVRGIYTDSSTGYVYLADNDGRLEDPGWLVTADYSSDGQLQRYWIDSTAHACIPGLSLDGWAHYTTSAGYVLRGSQSTSDGVLLADNDGLLASGSGWLVTGTYTNGELQRYWLESRDGYSVAKTGLFSVDGSYYYGRSTGYVVRGRWTNSSTGYIYLADNDGKLLGGESGGWVVTDLLVSGELQRYWIDPDEHAAIPGYSSDGWAHYTTSEGYVLRGKLATGNYVLLADDDGLLASGTGWLVTGTYDGGELQRYWLESLGNGYYGALTGSFTVDGSMYYGTSNGYVLRNAVQQIGSTWYRADNDGKLTEGAGDMWAVAQQYTSATGYLLLIDSSTHTVGVFQGTGNAYEWSQFAAWPCGDGAWSTPTVKGVFTVQSRGYSFGSGYTCYYWVQFYGDYLFHSILYYPNTFIVQDGTLGAAVSHGCVRLSLENAKWIYDNIPSGTTVVSY